MILIDFKVVQSVGRWLEIESSVMSKMQKDGFVFLENCSSHNILNRCL